MEFRFVFLIVLLISTITSAYFTFSFPFVRVNNEDIELSVLQEFTNLKSYNNTEQETEQIEEETETERGNIGKENKAKQEVDTLTTTLPSTTTTTSTTTTAVKVGKEQTERENTKKLKTDTGSLTQTTPKTETDAERDAPTQPPTTTADTEKEATDKGVQTNGASFFNNLDFGLIKKFEVLTEMINYWMQEAETVENLINVVNQYKVIITNVVLLVT